MRNDDEYLVEVLCWGRSRDGDDWVDVEYSISFDAMTDAVDHANNPHCKPEHRIETRILHRGEIVYRRNFMEERNRKE